MLALSEWRAGPDDLDGGELAELQGGAGKAGPYLVAGR